jgi:hypothetical protein
MANPDPRTVSTTRQPRAPETRRPPERKPQDGEHEGATEENVGNLGGPGPGYDDEPGKDPDKGGVSRS